MITAELLDASRYEHGTRARYNSAKCRCFACRRANSAYESARQRDPRVPSDQARAHLLALSARGIGRRAVEAATDIDESMLSRIAHGHRQRIRRSMAAKILAVDTTCASDGALVPAAETQRMLREILRLGFTKTAVAARLGSDARVPSLQIRDTHVLAKTEQRVRRLHTELMAGEDDGGGGGEDIEIDDGPRARILRALRFFDRVSTQDLLDAMDVPEDDRNTYQVTLGRLVKAGAVERVGDAKPYEYRLATEAA